MIGGALNFLLIILVTITLSILQIIAIAVSTSDISRVILIFQWIFAIQSIFEFGVVIFMYLSKRVNTSPGACDNGSGSAILLELADKFAKTSLSNTNLTFLWCTAEEWGLYGSKGYVKAHKDELHAVKDRFFNINVDMVGSELAYLDKAGFPRKKPINSQLNSIIAEIAEREGIEIRKFNSLIGNNSDHASFKKEDLEVCMFLAKKDVKRIHSPKDTIEAVDAKHMQDAVSLIFKMIQHLDKN